MKAALRVVSPPPVAPRTRRRQARRLRRGALHDRALRAKHRRSRHGIWRYVLGGDFATLLSAPVIYSTIVPFVLLDAWVSLYQAVCFRLWGLRRVRRRHYFAIDRHKLAYLNGIEKANCLFCSYANGLIAYVREVAARTEQYWCPIRHARHTRHAHERSGRFASYGDPDAYRERLPVLRAALRK
jgi:hypothetical protein